MNENHSDLSKSLPSIAENESGTEMTTAKRLLSNTNRKNGGKDIEGDSTGYVAMGKDDEKEEEIADTKKSWRDIFLQEIKLPRYDNLKKGRKR